MTGTERPNPVDARAAQGVQVGEHGTQVNVFVTPESTGVRWPLRVGAIPALADCYQGRRQEAAQLDGSAATQVLSGLGGVGKSQLAAAYTRRLVAAGRLDLVLWVTATGRDAVLAGYAQAAREIGRAVPAEVAVAAEWFLAWLQRTERRWLVVLDDLANPVDLQGLWPEGAHGRALVTTRRRGAVFTGRGRQQIDVGLFSPEEARGYLTAKLADPGRLREADELAEDLAYLPLALAQAAAFILDRDETCTGYRARLAERRALAELFPADALADDYRSTVAATWAISIEAADQLVPKGLGGPLLRVCGVLDPNGFPAELVESAPVAEYLAAGATARDCHDALRNLARLNLVSLDPDGGPRAVRVHALVQRAALEHADQAEVTLVAADGLLSIWPDVDRDSLLVGALRANARALATGPLWRPHGHALLNRLGQSLVDGGLAAAAVEYWDRQLRQARQALGADHQDVLTARHAWAYALGRAGKLVAAIAAFTELLDDRLRVLGRDHPDVLRTRASLASWRGRAGDLQGAVADYQELFAECSRLLGPEHQDTLITRGGLARWRGEAGDAEGAVAAYQQLLTDRLRVLGPDHPDTLITRASLARWRGEAGDPAGAAAAFARVVEDAGRVLGWDHRDTLANRHSLASWRGRAGDPAAAAATFVELLADRTSALGPDHPDTLRTRGSLAFWRGQAGDHAGAVSVLSALLEDRRAVLGPDHPDTVRTQRDLAHWSWLASGRSR